MPKPNSNSSPKTNGLHCPSPKRPRASLPEPSLTSPPGQDTTSPSPKKKKKKRRKKRRHSEMEGEPAAAPSSAPEPVQVEPASEKKRKKKKKKRRMEEEPGDGASSKRACVPSHLEPLTQEEDWCQGGVWSLNSPGQQQQQEALPVEAPAPAAPEKAPLDPLQPQGAQGSDTPLDLKRRKKKRKRNRLKETETACLIPESVAGKKRTVVALNDEASEEPKKKKKKKKKRLKEESSLWEESRRPAEQQPVSEPRAAQSSPAEKPVETAKSIRAGTAAVVVWDSQVKEGYRRSQGPAGEQEEGKDAPRSAPLAWDGNKSSSVVEALLKNAADKAYGAQVLSWEGEASAISRDAIEDARHAKYDTVIDEWDEDFDSGKVKKMKAYKREKWRSGNSFQQIQDRKNMWSVTPGGKRNCFGFRR